MLIDELEPVSCVLLQLVGKRYSLLKAVRKKRSTFALFVSVMSGNSWCYNTRKNRLIKRIDIKADLADM